MKPQVVVGRWGRHLRFALGTQQFPTLDFGDSSSPEWNIDRSVRLSLEQGRFTLWNDDTAVLAGHADPAKLRLTVEVGDAEVLGFGAANGAPNRNRSRFRILALDTLMYAIPGASYTAMPFFIARDGERAVGVLVATTYPLNVVIGHGEVQLEAACETDGVPLDVIVLRGTLQEVVCALASVAGRSFLPPAWALGFHQSRWSYRTEREVREVARKLREHDLPADAIHLDIHYMDRYRVFTFHPRRFPDPARLHADLKSAGLRTMAIVDPGVSVAPYDAYRSLQEPGLLLRKRDGKPYVGRVWPGSTVFPDFQAGSARQRWAELHEPLLAAGIAGFWNDMNDPVLRAGEYYDPLAEDCWHGEVPHRRVRNVYANGMAAATAAALRRYRPGRRPFVLSRSGFLGIQRHAAIWTGDNHSSWEHLRENLDMVVNLGLTGVPLCGADVGGFARGPGRFGIFKPRRPSVELFVRWMELGALLPFFRVHCTLFARSQAPWDFGPRGLEACRRVLRRRYRLLPLLYRLALEANESGLPLVRPVCMHYAIGERSDGSQFLLGRDLLCAPVLERSATMRTVDFPAGSSWMDWHDGTMYVGGQSATVTAPLGRTPLFVRAGAALFLADPRRNSEDTLAAPLALEVAGAPGAAGRGSLFLDDGETASGERFLLDVDVQCLAGRLDLAFERPCATFVPQQTTCELRVPRGTYTTAVIDGRAEPMMTRSLSSEDREREVEVVQVSLRARQISLRH